MKRLRDAQFLREALGRMWHFFIPILTTSAVSSAGILINSAVVGRHDREALYAIGLYLPIYYVLLASQEAMRVASLAFSSTLSEKRNTLAGYLGIILTASVLVPLGMLVVVLVARQSVFDALHVAPAARHMVLVFMASMLTVGIMSSIANVLLSSLFGLGSGRIGSRVGVTSTVLNVALTALSVRLLHTGAMSLVYANAVVSTLATAIALGLLMRIGVTPSLRLPGGLMRQAVAEIARLSLPVAGSYLVIFSFLFVFDGILGHFPQAGIAGFSVAYRVQTFAVLPAVALGIATGIMINRSNGSGRGRDGQRIFLLGVVGSLTLYLPISVAIVLLREPLVALFSNDLAVQAVARDYMATVGPTYLVFGPLLTTMFVLEQLGLTLRVFAINLVSLSAEAAIAWWVQRNGGSLHDVFTVIAVINGTALLWLAYEVVRRVLSINNVLPAVVHEGEGNPGSYDGR
ncbi:hypothetical protein WJ41_13785 [Burkholderia ubonensis]|uniref:MATE family efflux transporter n=1 Tax=Burkholderia ubonensis TaxID=101571 RepID=UPI000758DAAF|nr:MATE family efflux transporter [Burkholderia ubonensis]KVH72198.1 hypothetical protein WJ41_13785 [Burkholderia ubonensis]KVU04716.1 hypothetical protein WK61_02345 [Burkholderia ubonensis]